ncbi:DUF3040 domain-containing protein [Actinoplanes sp. GCM10030250]|uniref:DUF3040 domain-containing protein n=1 Tax=Actinoplanes sp. GCM10030250 TaxID=3273376 RepID=UPI003620E499
MLSEADRRRLAQIEQELQAQDPLFAQRLSSATPPSASPRWCGMSATSWLVAAVFTGCLAMLLKSGGMAVIALLALCLSMGLWAANNGPRG